MRCRLQAKDRETLFGSLKEAVGSWSNFACDLQVSVRTLSAWKSGYSSIPGAAFQKMKFLTNFNPVGPVEELSDYWYTSHAGTAGAQVKYKVYGNPGTPEGRRKGGLQAIQTHRSNEGSKFKLEKNVASPDHSPELAEVLGIFFGDGHAGKYQATVTLNSETDCEYIEYVRELIRKLFCIESSPRKKLHKKAIDIVISSIAFSRFLALKGMPAGNKIQTGLFVPQWIKKEHEYAKAFIRGLFDTDGCVYMDKHIINSKKYLNLGWTITSYSASLVNNIQEILRELGFHPTHSRGQHSVFLRKHQEIVNYFKIIGTSNSKHQRRFQQFIMEKSHSG